LKLKTQNNVREVRTLTLTELRSVTDADGKNYLEGYAARYNVRSSDLGWGMYEILMPGAFTRALAEGQDVRHLVNHDPSLLLGRTKSGTTVLSEDDKGLKFRTLLPDTQLARDLQVSIARGDINECSFGFMCRKATWVEETDEKGNTVDIRQVQDVDLFDVSTVTYPAYPETNTDLAMRALFPYGPPAEILALNRLKRSSLPPNEKKAALAEFRSLLKRQDDGANVDGDGDPGTDGDTCDCPCPYCEQDRCEFCCNEYCRDENCFHGYPANHNALRAKDGEKTKRIDGEDLPASAFLIVLDKDKTETWNLPVHFSTEAKTLTHLKDALARFDQLKDVPEDVKKAAWEKLVKLAESHGINVSDDDKAKHASVDPQKIAAQIAVNRALLKIRAVMASI
jgi:uncharacterized protein